MCPNILFLLLKITCGYFDFAHVIIGVITTSVLKVSAIAVEVNHAVLSQTPIGLVAFPIEVHRSVALVGAVV